MVPINLCHRLPLRAPLTTTEPIARRCVTFETFYYWGPWRNASGWCDTRADLQRRATSTPRRHVSLATSEETRARSLAGARANASKRRERSARKAAAR
jgi:hypothetical protein